MGSQPFRNSLHLLQVSYSAVIESSTVAGADAGGAHPHQLTPPQHNFSAAGSART